MSYKNLALIIISVSMALLIPIIIYGYAFNFAAFDKDFYKKEFLRHDVYKNLPDYDIEDINDKVLDYLKNRKKDSIIGSDFFNEREKAHLLDVKHVIQKTFGVYYFSIAMFFIFLASLAFLLDFHLSYFLKRICFIMLFGGILALAFAFLLFALYKTDFDFAFGMLHETFFPVGTYTFNPDFEKIVVLYPEILFSDAFAEIISIVIFSSVIVFSAGFAVLFCFFRRKFSNFFRLNYRRKTK